MTEAAAAIEVDKQADTTVDTKTVEIKQEPAKATATDATKTADVAKTIADKTAAGEAAKEFVADPKKSDEENAKALAEFEKANAQPEKKGLPDDWREIAAGNDEAALKLAKRYGSMSGVLKALKEAQDTIRSGKVKTTMPDPKDEKAMAEWRKAEGLPEDPTGYKLPETIQKRLVDEDKPVLANFTEFAFAKNAPPAFVEMASEWYVNMAEAAQAKQIEDDKTHKADAEDALRKDWAHGEYKANTTMAARWIEGVPGLGKDWAAVRGPDGRLLGSNPEFVAWAAEQGRSRFGDLAFTTGDAERKHSARKEEIEKIMKSDINAYREQGLDKEYQQILDAELKRRK